MDHQLFSQPNDLFSHLKRSKPTDEPVLGDSVEHKEPSFNPYVFNAGTVLGTSLNK